MKNKNLLFIAGHKRVAYEKIFSKKISSNSFTNFRPASCQKKLCTQNYARQNHIFYILGSLQTF